MTTLACALRRVALVVCGLVAGLAVVEGLLRVRGAAPVSVPYTDLSSNDADPALRGMFEVEPGFGFRPVLGGRHYDTHGAQRNDYTLAKAPGTERFLFIGDSVTARGRIVGALARRAPRPGREWWIAGVESYDLTQTLAYFRRYLGGIAPDRVVLTFHVNDFQTTPVSFVDADGERHTFAPPPPRSHLWPFGWRHFAVWRAALLPFAAELDASRKESAPRDALAGIATLCRERGADLHVLVLPPLQDPATWPTDLRRWHALAVRYCDELDLAYTDLAVPLVTALVAGIDPQEIPGDWAHPSQPLADLIADHLIATGVVSR